MGIMDRFNDEDGKVSTSNGKYRVMQIVLREKFIGKGSKNFREIEDLCNEQCILAELSRHKFQFS